MYCQSCLKAYSFPSLHSLSTEMSNKHPRQGFHLGCHSQVIVFYLKTWSDLMLRISQTLSRTLGTMWWFHWSHALKIFESDGIEGMQL